MSRIVPLFLALATSAAFAPALVSAETLTITIAGIRESEGRLMIQVANSEKGFEFSEDSAAPPPVAISQLAEAGEMTFEVTLPPGIYGARVLHDLNGNISFFWTFICLACRALMSLQPFRQRVRLCL